MQDDRVARREVLHRRADLAHPSRVLVPQRVGQGDVALRRPLPLDDVQIRPAQTGAADVDDDVQRTRQRRLRDLLDHAMPGVLLQSGPPS